MKWISFFIAACTLLVFVSPPSILAEAEKKVEIVSIDHAVDGDKNETITFVLSDTVTPRMFSLRGDNPRLVIDFPLSSYSGKNVVTLADGRLATAIRAGFHKVPVQKTRIVVDLAKQITVAYTSEYIQQKNRLVVTLRPDVVSSLEAEAVPAEETTTQELAVLPSREELAAKPLDEKPIPPVFSVKELDKSTAPPKPEQGGTAQLLGISFDDSSNRGEMVLFHLNDFYPPLVSAIEKENPRVLCDFMDMDLTKEVEETIFANGKYVERIRAAKHENPSKVRVVLDLSPDRDYDLQQVFFKNDNLFVLIVNELPPGQEKQ